LVPNQARYQAALLPELLNAAKRLPAAGRHRAEIIAFIALLKYKIPSELSSLLNPLHYLPAS
ncbi:MAG: hypothetical protein ABSG71_19120, partial [Thermodesulfobacteriota bacterium]